MSAQQNPANMEAADREQINTWILQLSNPETRENALFELCKRRNEIPDLAPLLWEDGSTIAALLQEISDLYEVLAPPTLTSYQCYRGCNVLSLLQRVAGHPETRSGFLQSQILRFLFPLLYTQTKTKPVEVLRLCCLGIIGTMIKDGEQEEVFKYLLTTEIVPVLLWIMGNGHKESKIAASILFNWILANDSALSYVCHTQTRILDVAMVLSDLVLFLVTDPSVTILTNVVGCYLYISKNPMGRAVLRQWLPDQLRDETFTACLQDNNATKDQLEELIKNLE